MGEETQREDDHDDEEQHPRDPGEVVGQAAEAEDRGDDRDHEESDRPSDQHDEALCERSIGRDDVSPVWSVNSAMIILGDGTSGGPAYQSPRRGVPARSRLGRSMSAAIGLYRESRGYDSQRSLASSDA